MALGKSGFIRWRRCGFVSTGSLVCGPLKWNYGGKPGKRLFFDERLGGLELFNCEFGLFIFSPPGGACWVEREEGGRQSTLPPSLRPSRCVLRQYVPAGCGFFIWQWQQSPQVPSAQISWRFQKKNSKSKFLNKKTKRFLFKIIMDLFIYGF